LTLSAKHPSRLNEPLCAPCACRHDLNLNGSFILQPLIAGIAGRMWIGGSSKVTRTAEGLLLPFGSGSPGLG
jgi:hypothetical protein